MAKEITDGWRRCVSAGRGELTGYDPSGVWREFVPGVGESYEYRYIEEKPTWANWRGRTLYQQRMADGLVLTVSVTTQGY